jgi:hypothetical protein
MLTSLTEVDVKREIEFNRGHLGTVIPKRLLHVLEVLDGARGRLEPWYGDLLIKVGNSIARVCQDLFQTMSQEEALPAAAWNARNLLELWVWIKYCSASKQNAWRFHEDALRDAKGLSESHIMVCKLFGIQDDYEESRHKVISNIAFEQLGLDSVDKNYQKVEKAARNVDMGGIFQAWNVYLSKFAHPTAGLVLGFMHQSDAVRRLQSTCTTVGLYCCDQCVIVMESTISSIPPERGVAI